jgi:hypothetical protein
LKLLILPRRITLSFIRRIKKGKNIYLAEVENKWINGKCVQKHLRYIGREADGKTLLSVSISEVEVDEVKAFGPLLVLNYLARQLDLHELLGRYWNGCSRVENSVSYCQETK